MTIAEAPAPSRSTASAVLNWGLINIDVQLYTTTEETRVARSEYVNATDADGNAVMCKVGRMQYNKDLGGEVLSADIVKMATATDGTLVELTDEEIAAATTGGDGTAPIVAIVPITDVFENYRVDKYYQARPRVDKKGASAHEKAFALLMAALKQRNSAALIRISIRKGAAQYAALTSDGALAVLHFVDGVRADRTMPMCELTEKELEMAGTLLDAISSTAPTMRDETAERIQAFVDMKAAGADTTVTVTPPTVAAGSLEDLLAASIEAVA